MIFTIYHHELRANRLAIVALPFLCLGAALLIHVMKLHGFYGATYESVFQGDVTASVMLATIAAGLCLGISHIVRDLPPAMWAFTTHRPVSPFTLLTGKLLSALTLYFLLMLPPLAIVILWAATPGHLPGPWEWRLAIPRLIDLFCGTLYIPAAMLLLLREARWAGTRLFPLISAFACTIGTLTVYDASTAALIILAGWVIAISALVGAIRSRYRPSAAPRYGMLAAALALSPACVILPVVITNMLPAELDEVRATWTVYQLDHGAVYRRPTYRGSRFNGEMPGRMVLDRDGQPIDREPERGGADYWPTASVALRQQWGSRTNDPSKTYRSINHYVESAGTRARDGRWVPAFFSYASGLFSIYDGPIAVSPDDFRAPAKCVGYIGRNGRSDDPSKAEPFTPVIASWSFIAEPTRAYTTYKLDASGSLLSLMDLPPGESWRDASLMIPPGKPDILISYLVATDKALYLIDAIGRQTARIPYPSADIANISLEYDPEAHHFNALYAPIAVQQPTIYQRFTPDGQILLSRTLPGSEIQGTLPVPGYRAAMLPICPPALTAAAANPSWNWLIMGAQIAIAAMLQSLFLRHSRSTLSIRAFWLLLTIPGGWSAVLLHLAMRISAITLPNTPMEPDPAAIFDHALQLQ